MKVTATQIKKEFVPFTVSITFESDDDLYGSNGFLYRYDNCIFEHGNWMSCDNTCREIRKVIADLGYPKAQN